MLVREAIFSLLLQLLSAPVEEGDVCSALHPQA